MNIIQLKESNEGLYNTDKMGEGQEHHYGEFYAELTKSFKSKKLDLLEIGVERGGSLRLFHDYLTQANITGIDIKNQWCGALLSDFPRITLKTQNAYQGIEGEYHVIIDDGSHTFQDQLYAIQNFPYNLKKGGILIIEDVPEGFEQKLMAAAPNIGIVNCENFRHIGGRWDDCIITFKRMR